MSATAAAAGQVVRLHFDGATLGLYALRGGEVFYVFPELVSRFEAAHGGGHAAFEAALCDPDSVWWREVESSQGTALSRLAVRHFRDDPVMPEDRYLFGLEPDSGSVRGERRHPDSGH